MGRSQGWRDVLDAADVQSALVMVRLLMNDALSMLSAGTYGKSSLDAQRAEHLFRQELRELQTNLQNRQAAEQLEKQENTHQEALEAAAFGWKFKQDDNHVERVPSPSPPPPPVKLEQCVICTDEKQPEQLVKVPCSHKYCADCLEDLYNRAVVDETLFPPRCCQKEFPWELVRAYLSHQCRSKFGAKRREFETKDRTYCHIPTCSAFISPDAVIGHWARCPVPGCKGDTCTLCKNAYHFGPCQRDEALDMVLQTAGKNEWKQCGVCRRVIELKYGCNHITCVCRNEFCYVCGAAWKTCNCPKWDEARLLERAGDVVDNRAPRNVNQNDNRDAQIAQAAEYLQQNHECQHTHFRTFKDYGNLIECEVCNLQYPNWIKQCKQCLMLVCGRCKYNRL